MKKYRSLFIILTILSAVLLSIGFLLPHCGGFALIAFVPLLWMDRIASKEQLPHFFWWYWMCFLLFNALTTFWVCNATVGGGIAAIVINSLLMSIIWALFRLFSRRFKGTLPYIFLAAAWIAWEKFYFGAEVSWPWLTLGNAFAGSTTCVQWYEVTGLMGGSLWIWLCNLSVFGLTIALSGERWKKGSKNGYTAFAKAAFVAGTVLVFLGPLLASWIRYATFTGKSESSIAAITLQPNFDPYQKFESLSQADQTAVLAEQADRVLRDICGQDSTRTILLVGPETFTNDVVLNDIMRSRTLCTLKSHLAPYPNANMLLGASTYEILESAEAPSVTARKMGNGRWYEDRNSAVMIDRTPRIELYHKSRLVVGVEKMPWPEVMRYVDNWLGGVMGHCISQDHVSLLDVMDDGERTSIGAAICYESIYYDYFAEYVKAGAKAMTVITNDAWWGDTPGYRQHLRYSCLRAIETRRDIVRCANTGLSAFINQRGDIVSCSKWWEREELEGEMHFSSHITPFVKYGDVAGRLATFVFLLMVFALGANLITRKGR